MTEQWKAVPGYEHAYEVSDLGRVRSVARIDSRGHGRKEKLLAPGRANTHGHLSVSLSANGVSRSRYVHHLVLTAFIGPRPDGMGACHDVPTDNRLVNLRWDTPSANTLDSVRNGNRGPRRTAKAVAA
jgi:hypothetical protein